MSTQTRERNYRKNPHTARFLQTFHSAIGSNGRNYREEMNVVSTDMDEDLLNLVPVGQGFPPSPAQETFIYNLVVAIAAMDAALGIQAANYNNSMTANNAWTRENTSRWINNLIAKRDALRAATPRVAPTTVPAAEVADGRYAVEEDGVLKFFKVKNGNRPGFVFLDIQASDEWHAIRDLGRIRRVVALIAQDTEEASLRYGRELGVCGDCGRTLTKEVSRARGRGDICDAKH